MAELEAELIFLRCGYGDRWSFEPSLFVKRVSMHDVSSILIILQFKSGNGETSAELPKE